jgi:conjugal transfer pilus assembly protein TraI
VIDRNLQANADRYGVPQFGSHLERYLVDAMRRLASGSPSWFPNREKSRAWLGPDGLFLLWPQAAHDVQALLEADQLAGIPKAPETMLDCAGGRGLRAAADGASTGSSCRLS